jgi:hypothetical protein
MWAGNRLEAATSPDVLETNNNYNTMLAYTKQLSNKCVLQ